MTKKVFKITYPNGENATYTKLSQLYNEHGVRIKIGIQSLYNALFKKGGVWEKDGMRVERQRVIPATIENGECKPI